MENTVKEPPVLQSTPVIPAGFIHYQSPSLQSRKLLKHQGGIF